MCPSARSQQKGPDGSPYANRPGLFFSLSATYCFGGFSAGGVAGAA